MESIRPYKGDEPYIFISYAHEDGDIVFSHLEAMQRAGYRFWYDKGISAGERWRDAIAVNIEKCAACVVFYSASAKKSRDCYVEMNYIVDNKKTVILFYLEEVALSSGLRMYFSPMQSVKRSDCPTPEAFIELLNWTESVQPCRELEPERSAAGQPEPERSAEGQLEAERSAEPEAATIPAFAPVAADTGRNPATADAGAKRARRLPPVRSVYVNGSEIFNAGPMGKPLSIAKAAGLTFEAVLNDYLGSVPAPNKIRTVEAFIRANPTFLRFEAVNSAQFAAKEALKLKGFSSPVYLATRNDTPTKQRYVTRLYDFLSAAGQKSDIVWLTTDGKPWTWGENIILI